MCALVRGEKIFKKWCECTPVRGMERERERERERVFLGKNECTIEGNGERENLTKVVAFLKAPVKGMERGEDFFRACYAHLSKVVFFIKN